MPGSHEPDQWVIRGNHHDAWVNGADDPISGQVALLEEARALGRAAKQGWKPQAHHHLLLWDGEEPQLLGSTEWAETARRGTSKEHAAIYINSRQQRAAAFSVRRARTRWRHFVNGVAKGYRRS